jgi:4-oxalocrotonate tautomerase
VGTAEKDTSGNGRGLRNADVLVAIVGKRTMSVSTGIGPRKESSMPYVNIKITREGATAEQKARLIEGVTKLLSDILGKNPQTTFVVIDEVETDNWGIGGETVTARRRRGR